MNLSIISPSTPDTTPSAPTAPVRQAFVLGLVRPSNAEAVYEGAKRAAPMVNVVQAPPANSKDIADIQSAIQITLTTLEPLITDGASSTFVIEVPEKAASPYNPFEVIEDVRGSVKGVRVIVFFDTTSSNTIRSGRMRSRRRAGTKEPGRILSHLSAKFPDITIIESTPDKFQTEIQKALLRF